MNQTVIGPDDYIPLAEKINKFIGNEIPLKPSAYELTVVVAALECVSKAISAVLKEKGFDHVLVETKLKGLS